jgi:Acetyltransferases, including N-acetylases of ribosomal proteins
MTDAVELRTERFEIRTMREDDDLSPLKTWFADPAFCAKMNSPAYLYDDDKLRRYLAAFDNRTSFFLGLFDRASGFQFGYIIVTLDRRNRNGIWHVGFYDRRYRGREGVYGVSVAVIDWIFKERGMMKLVSRIDASRTAFRAVLSRLGFVLEGVLRSELERADGSGRIDQAQFGLLADEWPEVRRRILERLRERKSPGRA